MSTGPYEEAARRALTEVGNPFPMSFVSGWHLHPGFISLLANRVHKALAQLPGQSPQMVLFTAHSLPVRITQTGDPYLSHLQETCQAVAEEALLNTYRLAFQSASRTPEPWLGPSASEALVKLHSEGIREVVVCPVGFVSDHLEILYDIDCKLREQAVSLGVNIQRTQSLNADPDFIAVLADVVQKTVPCD
jgi:ferrochelatase